MLSTKTTETVLLVAPSIKHLKKYVKNKLFSYADIKYHQIGLDADTFFSMVMKEKDHYDALSILENAVTTAISMLPNLQREIIEHTYFDRMSRRAVADLMGLKRGKVQYQHDRAFQKLQTNLYFLGITNKFLIKYFNNDGIFINFAEYGNKYLHKDNNGEE